MALKTVKVDGEDHIVITERSSSDGGVVVNYLSPLPDGTHANLRHWFQDPSLADEAFAVADDAVLRTKKVQIRDMIGAKQDDKDAAIVAEVLAVATE